MFTGIVEELGEVVAVDRLAEAARVTVRGGAVVAGAARGDSIAVNGVCLTVTSTDGEDFTADVMAETLRRTTLGTLAPGSRVNLERPLLPTGRLGGHLVQGHVDGVGTVVSRNPAEHWDVVRVAIPPALGRYLVEKGSVAVDGVSLTVSVLGEGEPPGDGGDGQPWFEVSLIPATLAATTLGQAQPGTYVNLEVDVIGKYVERMLRDLAVRP
ncbi:MAG TPA: riboflavin synthase [Streptosporangiaceae bacterium]|nr:riboflavin synthase [Streptosporangiaceae bacterium]